MLLFLAVVLAGEGLATASLWAAIVGAVVAVIAAVPPLADLIQRDPSVGQTVRAAARARAIPGTSNAVTRRAQQDAVVDALLRRSAPDSGTVTVLHGLAGSGKTTLAAHVCDHPRVRRRFYLPHRTVNGLRQLTAARYPYFS
jgi:hypothetical protein